MASELETFNNVCTMFDIMIKFCNVLSNFFNDLYIIIILKLQFGWGTIHWNEEGVRGDGITKRVRISDVDLFYSF